MFFLKLAIDLAFQKTDDRRNLYCDDGLNLLGAKGIFTLAGDGIEVAAGDVDDFVVLVFLNISFLLKTFFVCC